MEISKARRPVILSKHDNFFLTTKQNSYKQLVLILNSYKLYYISYDQIMQKSYLLHTYLHGFFHVLSAVSYYFQENRTWYN